MTDVGAITGIPAADDVLEARQAELQAEGRRLLDELAVEPVLAEVGPVRYTGSFVSGLMSWPDLDVMVLSDPQFAPADVLAVQSRIITKPGVIGFDYRDERGSGCSSTAFGRRKSSGPGGRPNDHRRRLSNRVTVGSIHRPQLEW